MSARITPFSVQTKDGIGTLLQIAIAYVDGDDSRYVRMIVATNDIAAVRQYGGIGCSERKCSQKSAETLNFEFYA